MNSNLRRIRYTVILLILLISKLGVYAQKAEPLSVDGVIRVKIKPELSEQMMELKSTNGSAVEIGMYPLDVLARTYNTTQIKRVFRYDPKFEHKLIKHGLHLWYEITYTNSAKVSSVASEYGNLESIEIAEPIYKPTLFTGQPVYLTNEEVAEILNTGRGEEQPFNDPYLPMQWHYNNTGQTGGYVGADINLFEAWKVSTGASNVIVSIHDQGVDWDHEDLIANMWINEAELNGEDMVDDDGNGFKDDIYGFNFAENRGTISPDYHGTHVAGTVGAMNNNGIGVAGVAGGTESTPGVKMMSCQIFGGVSTGNTPESFIYAANNGAVISQNSWGYSTPGYYNQAVLDAIDYFIEEAGDYPGSPMKGGIVIFASGNNASEEDHWPGTYEKVINVSSLDAKRGKASYSNYHASVDLSAPGGEARDDANLPDGQEDAGYSNGVLSTFNSNAYGYLDGTSMACPHVSGIAALVLSKYGGDGFTPEKLRTHLLTATVNIDTVPENEPYIGKLGKGASDAALALIEDTKVGPLKTEDLSVSGVTQEFAKLQWTVPADEDDGIATSYEILYAEQAITDASIEYAKIRTLDNTKKIGEKIEFDVLELKALTTYYFRIRSLDRWGNHSQLSNEVMATTNSGPDAWIDKSDFSMHTEYIGWTQEDGNIYDTTYYMPVDINTVNSVEGSNSFSLHNDGEGLLRWSVLQRHIESIDANSTSTPNYLVNTPDINYLNANVEVRNAPVYGEMKPLAQEEDNKYKSYITPWGAQYYYIGETDTSLSNSSATRFFIDEEDGFNLTNIDFFINYESTAEKPVILEVYSGWDINEAKLSYSEELTETSVNWNSMNLKEQIYFDHGEYFWLVIHIPAGPLYPLGASTENEKDDSQHAYISLNMGKTWALFEDLYYDNNIVWAVNAYSLYKTPGDYLMISPASGELANGEQSDITVGANASTMINGTYKANVVIETNETNEPQLRAQTWLEIEGQQPIIVGQPIVDFGSVLYGEQKIIEVTLSNEGYGKFYRPAFTFSNTDEVFSLVGTSSTINPRSEITFQFLYNPQEIGNASSKVTLSNSKGQQYEFNLIGVCAEPPVLEIEPAVVNFDDVTIGDELSGSFSIKNTGKYPLSFYMPTFSSGESVGEVSGDFCKYGYSYSDNGGGNYTSPVFDWIDISESGTQITDYSNEFHYFHYPVEMGFDFPFFGKLENQVYVTNYGLVSFDTNSSFSSSPIYFKRTASHDRFISALGKWHDLSFAGKIYYQDFGDKLIVQYSDVTYGYYDKTVWQWKEPGIEYQIVLHANGNINFYYNDFGGVPETDITMWTFFGIEDKTTDDGLLISQQYSENLRIGNEMAIEITNPGLGLITELSTAEGVVQAGETLNIDFKASTDILNVENHVENLPILTNDPFNNPGILSLNINVTGGGESELTISNDNFDYGQVFQGDVKENLLWVVNEGRATDTIQSVELTNGHFTIEGDLEAILSPKRKTKYTIGLNTDALGIYNDVMTVTSKNGEVFTINLNAEVIEAPQISTDVSSITQTLADDKQASHTITISNNGGNNLEVAPIGNEWLTVSKASTLANEVPEFTYILTRSEDEGGPTFTWEEIYGNGTYAGLLDSWGNQAKPWSEAIDMPFTFNYYGNDYDQFYIGANGVMSFSYSDVGEGFGANGMFPTPLEPNNVIAPMWGFIYPTWYEEGAGAYYHANNERVIIEWYKYIDGFYMAYPISFQVILYPDGNIKYQYNMADIPGEALTNFSGIGLENEDGTEGMTVGWGQYGIVSDKTALLFSPTEKLIIEPGQSEQIEVMLSSSNIYAGEHNFDFVLYNNTPDAGEYSIPVSLTVTGEAQPEYPTEVEFGEVQAYGKEFIQEFEISNNGNKPMEITDFITTNISATVLEAWVPSAFGIGGDTQVMWVNVKQLPEFDATIGGYRKIYVLPNESLKLRAKITPTTDEAINDNLGIETDIQNIGDINIAITAQPVLPPVIEIEDKKIEVFAPTHEYTENFSFNICNLNGDSDLEFAMDIQFIRDLPIVSSTAGASTMSMVNAPALETLDIENSVQLKKTNSTAEDFNRTLSHTTADQPEKALGYGGGMIFHSATRFTAPGDGFNLTHVQTWYTPGEWLESKIIVKILTGGSMIQECQEVYRQEFTHTIESADPHGSYITVQLDEAQLFFPDEQFYVVFQFPVGAAYPQGVAHVDEPIENRFMFGEGENWFDISTNGFPEYGWMMKACEAEFKVAVWAEIKSELNGSIAAGEELAIDMRFDAAYADYGLNRAEISISSNDPLSPKVLIPVELNKNMGPLFNLGTETYVSVNEGETLYLDIIAEDLEGDSFTLKLAKAYDKVMASFDDKTLKFSFNTDFEMAGIYSYDIIGEDEHGNQSSFVLNVDVVNVNQAPMVSSSIEDLRITLPNDSVAHVDLLNVFVDPDEQTLTYQITAEWPEGFEVFQSNDKVIFSASTIGTVPVNIKAIDPDGAEAETSFELVAVMRTGIDDNSFDHEVKVYPIPVEDELTIIWEERSNDIVQISIVDVRGTTIIMEEKSAGINRVINMSGLDAGVYFVNITSGEDTVVKKVIKK